MGIQIFSHIRRAMEKNRNKGVVEKLDRSTTVTAGSTADGMYSLCVQKYDGRPCLCVHRCRRDGGWHFSNMDEGTFVAAIDVKTMRRALEFADRGVFMTDGEKRSE